MEAVPLSEVDIEFMQKVERYQKQNFNRVGTFDIALLRELVEQVDEDDVIGEVELMVMANNKMHDDTTSGLIVVKYKADGLKVKYIALAGITDVPECG